MLLQYNIIYIHNLFSFEDFIKNRFYKKIL